MEKYTDLLLHLVSELKNPKKLAVSNIINKYACSPYTLQAMMDAGVLERTNPGEYQMKILTINEPVVERVWKATRKRQDKASRMSNLKKKQEEEEKQRKKVTPSDKLKELNNQVKQKNIAEMKDIIAAEENVENTAPIVPLMEHAAIPQTQIIPSEILELRKQLQEAAVMINQKDIEIDRLKKKGDPDLKEEIEMLREYLHHIQERDIQQITEIKRLKRRLGE